MNELKIRANPITYYSKSIPTIHFISDNIDISLANNNKNFELLLSSKKGIKAIEKKFYEVYNFLFLIIGYFPRIQIYQINGIEIDISMIAGKYNTSSHFIKSYSPLCSIDKNIVNANVLSRFTSFVHGKSLSSLEYLTCAEYEHVVVDHKFVLVLHIIDGFIKNSYKEEILLKEARREYGNKAKVKYKKRVRSIFTIFFYYHRKFNCEILKLLDVNTDNFIENICHTRDGLSHLINMPNIISKGDLLIRYFDLTIFSLRLFLLKELAVPLMEDNVKEYLNVFHDWIAEHKYGEKANLKSITYNQNKSVNEMVKMFRSIQKDI